MTPALPASSPPPNWVESNHPLGWLIDRLLAVEPLRQLLFWQARRLIMLIEDAMKSGKPGSAPSGFGSSAVLPA